MKPVFDVSSVAPLRERLNRHPIYGAVRTIEDARVFMAHHVYPVWDFMSLVKYLQNVLAPAHAPWFPQGDPALRRFINEIVLGEESDEGPPDRDGRATYTSHFELYCQAMEELGGDAGAVRRFVEGVEIQGISTALRGADVPAPARVFMQTTFDLIDSDKPHVVAAAFSLGREHIIPDMFRALLRDMRVTREMAPALHYYLERHIHLDEEQHGPMALRMLDELCAGDAVRRREATDAAVRALNARLTLWDGVLAAIQAQRGSDTQVMPGLYAGPALAAGRREPG
jgi:hypothetical protein